MNRIVAFAALLLLCIISPATAQEQSDARAYGQSNGWAVSFDGIKAEATSRWSSETFNGASGRESREGSNRASIVIQCEGSTHAFAILLDRPLAGATEGDQVRIRLPLRDVNITMTGTFSRSAVFVDESGISRRDLRSLIQLIHGRQMLPLELRVGDANAPLIFLLPQSGRAGAVSTDEAMGLMALRCR